MKNFLFFFLCVLTVSCSQKSIYLDPSVLIDKLDFKYGQYVNVDGKILAREWSDARVFQIPMYNDSRAKVYYKTNGGLLYFAFEIYEKVIPDTTNSEIRIWISADHKNKDKYPSETEYEFRLAPFEKGKENTESLGNGKSYFNSGKKRMPNQKDWLGKPNLTYQHKWTAEFVIPKEKIKDGTKIADKLKIAFYIGNGEQEMAFPSYSPKKWLPTTVETLAVNPK
ncbi:MAG: hypothetical protein DWQ06_14360 [Calditrichaeota bacterium]|nr:MAG: hypothetical protein DWQ06_14360 [Calditrichota bacterium]